MFDRYGNIHPSERGQQGLYHCDTRYLSRLVLLMNGKEPLLLNSWVSHANLLLGVDLANPLIEERPELRKDMLHIYRGRFLREGALHEQMRFTNYGSVPLQLRCDLEFAADFKDIFEIRGTRRRVRGEMSRPSVEDGQVVLSYRGRDDVTRSVRIRLEGGPAEPSEEGISFRLDLEPRSVAAWVLTIKCDSDPPDGYPGAGGGVMPGAKRREAGARSYTEGWQEAKSSALELRDGFAAIRTSSDLFNDWWNRSLDDLVMLTTELPSGPYPYAGIPWFSNPFGRDALVTALECLWLAPFLTRGVLAYLASTQAENEDPERDAEPGKILHEARAGEMAALGEVPFGRYYGSIDSTPLFLILAGAYYKRTGDLEFMRQIKPNLERALAWMNESGDRDGDGFLEYERYGAEGLENQGWKDSWNSIFHADGELANGPIATVEVQAYAYRARRDMAAVLGDLGDEGEAEALRGKAEALRERFEADMWCEELGTYGLGLDGSKSLMRVRTSNAGHALLGGIASPERAARTAASLMDDLGFSGWGIRTVAASEARYNPMSYHNGSVWPHDNALIADGFRRYGFTDLALRVLTGLHDASLFMELRRMPELFCGFHRRAGDPPTLYPVACSPQAWAAGSVCLLLQAVLGISIHGREGSIEISEPRLPEFLDWVEIENLRLGDGTTSLRFARGAGVVEARSLGGEARITVSSSG